VPSDTGTNAETAFHTSETLIERLSDNCRVIWTGRVATLLRSVRARGRIMTNDDPPESTFMLLDRARKGDDDALEELFQRHLGPLRRWARGRLPDWARDLSDTDDLVQDTLLRTFKQLDGFDPRGTGALQAYLRQAIINRVRDELRRKGRRPDRASLEGLELTADASPYEEMIGREALQHYAAALQRLRTEEREAIVARVEMGYSYEELARVLGKPTADAARKAAQRALVRLAEEMRALRE
jgi:RNA polymerase sigma-70 factor, ECF subfamily